MAGLLKCDSGQALTEFAIVIPVVLLFFFAMLQFFEVVKATQLANYAAYVAARVYAVRASVDGHDQAQELATKAAALAMAPVARLVPGEAAGLGGSLTQLLPGDFPGLFQGAGERALRIAEGFLVAQTMRLNNNLGGGSVKITTSGNPKQVDVELNYPQPIYVPGLAEMWAIVAGDRGIRHSLKSLREGLDGIPGTVLPALELSESQLLAQFGLQPITLPKVLFPYINVRGKCSMGFSDWGSKDPDYRPRRPKTVQDAPVDEETKKKLADAQQAQVAAQEYENATKAEAQKCSEWNDARARLRQAQIQRDQVFNNPNSTQQQRRDADAALQQARIDEQNAASAYNAARQIRIQKQQILESITGQDYGDLNCE